MAQESLSRLFQGKEEDNNRKLIELLLRCEKLSIYQICEHLYKPKLGKKFVKNYGIIHNRIKKLESQKILEKKGEATASRTGDTIDLYGLSPFGLLMIIREYESDRKELRKLSEDALEKIQEKLKTYYQTFLKLYRLEKSESDSKVFQYDFDHWLDDKRSILSILKFFGHYPLIGESQALITFRRMVDVGFMLWASKKEFVRPMLGIEGITTWPFDTIGEIARKQKKFNELYLKLEETDSPLYDKLKSNYHKEKIEFLSNALDKATAEKLLEIPFEKNIISKTSARYQLTTYISNKSLKDVTKEAERNLRPHLGKKWSNRARYPSIAILLIEKGRLCIVSSNPNEISPEWKRYSDVYSPNEEGRFVLMTRR